MKIFNSRYSFRVISTLILLLGILIPTILTNTFFFSEFSKTYNKEHKDAIALNAQSLNQSLNQYFEKYSLVFDVISDSVVWDDITAINNDLTIAEVKNLYANITLDQEAILYQDYGDEYRALVSLISSYEENESIKAIYIGTPDKYVFTNEIGEGNTVLYGYEGETFDCTQRPWYIGAIGKGNDIYWSTPYVDKDNETIVLSASKTILDQDNNVIGVISMDVHIDNFTEEIVQLAFDDQYSRFILDQNGTYIFADREDVGTNIENPDLIAFLLTDEKFIELDNTVYTKIQNVESDWYIIETFSLNQVNVDMRNLLGSVWVYLLVLLVIIIVLSYIISTLFLRPINILTSHFNKIEEEKDISIDLLNNNNHRKNEFGLLFRSVKSMQKSVKDSMDQVEYLSYYDQLTEINNRNFFEKQLLELSKQKYLPLSIVMIDVNGLKLVNDAFGHQAGDELLKITGNMLKLSTRPTDVVARWGGDEFVLLLPHTDLKSAKIIVERILSSAANTKYDFGDVSLAIGVATKTDSKEDSAKIFRLAEQLMYQEKNNVESSVRSETINTIINTLFEKSPETKEHSTRVSLIATKIATEMKLPENVINDIKTIGTIHDIGKIVIDISILEKVLPLTKEERDLIENHSLIGSRMLSSTHAYTRLAPGVLHHHEKIDGTGYPNGLVGDQIPLESRIIAIADAFDAMISPRPYKDNSLSIEEAVAELKRCSGTQFDEEILNVFIDKVVKNLKI